MARIRTIKPEIAAHEDLFDLERETGLPIRFAWCMLFTVADREGRFQWRPRTLKAQILPHDEIDFSRVLDAWVTRAFVRKYRVGDEWYGWIPTFTKHQVINHRESPSSLPPIEDADEEYQPLGDACLTRDPREPDASTTRAGQARGEGKEGREGDRHASTTRQGKQLLPEGWTPSNRTIERLSREFGLRVPEDVDRYVAAFTDICKAKNYRYADFDAAFSNCVRQDWPKLRGTVVALPTAERKFAAPG